MELNLVYNKKRKNNLKCPYFMHQQAEAEWHPAVATAPAPPGGTQGAPWLNSTIPLTLEKVLRKHTYQVPETP